MRISDWSSDVRSSDLKPVSVTPGTSSYHVRGATSMKIPLAERNRPLNATIKSTATSTARFSSMVRMIFLSLIEKGQIGSASCREGGCQYGSLSVVADQLNKKKKNEDTSHQN